MKKKLAVVFMGMVLAASLAGCSNPAERDKESENTSSAVSESQETKSGTEITRIGTITDIGGINDQSFNQSVWEGLQQVEKDKGVEISYLESKQISEFTTNLDKMIDSGAQLIWGNGYTVADATLEAAALNPEITFGVIDYAFEDVPDNVFGVEFRAQESSFLAGYAAARTTKTDQVGFVGGQKSDTIDRFEWGYKAGVAYGAKELGKEITVDAQYAETFADAAKGKAIANKMYSSGCDIVFHAAGGTGLGVIEAAKEADKFVIGVDRDQAYLAPDNVLTSVLKNANVAVIDISERAVDGEAVGGQNFDLGLSEGCVGLPEENPNMDEAVYADTMKLQQEMTDGTLTAPANEEEYQTFVENLK